MSDKLPEVGRDIGPAKGDTAWSEKSFDEVISRAAGTIWPFAFIRNILFNGVRLPFRPTINFTGAGVSVADTSGQTTVTIATSVTKGTSLLDFGAFPGQSDTTLAVTGQAGIVSGSSVEAWIQPAATADHSADEHDVESLSVFARDIVAATGFTLYGVNNSRLGDTRLYGKWNIGWRWQ